MKTRNIFTDWPININTGWGCYGRNLMTQIYQHNKEKQIAYHWALSIIHPNSIFSGIDSLPYYEQKIAQKIKYDSEIIYQKIMAVIQQNKPNVASIKLPGVVLLRLGGDYRFNSILNGDFTAAVSFIESTDCPPNMREILNNINRIYAGSSWNAQILKSHGFKQTKTIIQGIDPAYFYPGPALDFFSNRFYVFSGGKAEHRKGQDIVIKAFRAFSKTRLDTVLVTAWQAGADSIDFAHDLAHRSGLEKMHLNDSALVDIGRWLHDNGIPKNQYIDLGLMPNDRFPPIYRSMDVGLFPNRCEAGTNLVAMEAMACGMPVILSENTGHLDIIQKKSQLTLKDQSPVQESSAHFLGLDGWGESNVDEVIAKLEWAYDHRERIAQEGIRNATFMKILTWKQQIKLLLDDIDSHLV